MKKIAVSFSLLALPMLAFAQDLSQVQEFAVDVGGLVNILIPIAVALAVLFFFWGLAQFIFNSGDEGAKDEGKRKMIWGVVALFVIVSIWGLVGFLGQLFGIEQGGQAPVPGVDRTPGQGGAGPTPFGR